MNGLEIFDPFSAQISIFATSIANLPVTNYEEMTDATSQLKFAKKFEKDVEDQRKLMVGPLNDQVKEINAHAKKVMESLTVATKEIKQKIMGFEETLERQKQAELAKAEQARKEAEEHARAQAALDVSPVDPNSFEALLALESTEIEREFEEASRQAQLDRERAQIQARADAERSEIEQRKISGLRKIWTFDVEDVALVPREFLVIDSKAVTQAIRDGVREIPGLSISQKSSFSVRA